MINEIKLKETRVRELGGKWLKIQGISSLQPLDRKRN